MSAASAPAPSSEAQRTRKLLNVVAIVALVDFVLLVPLFLGMIDVIDTESYVGVVGMVHGIIFIGLVLLTGKGALERRWGWWFPILTIITGGAIGSLIGDALIRRRVSADAAA